jgi:hypothetical protein
MKQKRSPLALKADAFAAHAIPQPDPVIAATATPAAPPAQVAARISQPPRETQTEEGRAGAKEEAKTNQPSRAGKVQVVAWVPEERRAELKIVAAKLRRTVDDLLTSMIDDLLNKHLGN